MKNTRFDESTYFEEETLGESQPNVVDINLYRKKRDYSKQLVRSRVPLYVSHLQGQVDSPRYDLAARMASVDAQIEEMNDLIHILSNEEEYLS